MISDIATGKQAKRVALKQLAIVDPQQDDLSAARGIFAGVLMGAVLWLPLIVSIRVAHAELIVAPHAPAATTCGVR
ncbi:MAG TPA: hypothetical protein VJ376_11185 [Pseudomonadota bacterium]|nr:hypothetical protein [Pseudomonadota bacterium]